MLPYQLLRLASWTFSLMLGGVGIFLIYYSFYIPGLSLIAILMLIAAAITLRVSFNPR